jgi:pyrroloquinoline quinone (PQQ) biosynthesis protein C
MRPERERTQRVAGTTGQARPAREIVTDFARIEVASHPFFRELRAGPLDMQAIWILMANLRAGISRDFVVWLATTIARVDDRRIGSLAAKQLNDELGNGDPNRIHSLLLDRFLLGLEPWRCTELEEARLLAPGRRLAEESGRIFLHAAEPYEAVGALLVGEIFAEKMDHCVGDEIRRQHALSEDTLHWLTLHETLESDHAGDSSAIAELVPTSGPSSEAAWRGAVAQWDVLWRFLDGVDEIARARAGLRSRVQAS